MSQICIKCVKDNSLKALVDKEGASGEICSVCRVEGKILKTDTPKIQQLFKALIRFHYNEWEYNSHWGGGSLESLFYKENPILEYSDTLNELALEEVILTLLEKVYEEYDKGVTLFAGYCEDGSPAGILRSLKSEISPELSEIEERLKNENYFEVEGEIDRLLKGYLGVIDEIITTDKDIFRSRIGYIKKQSVKGFDFDTKYYYEPYTLDDIGAPPPRIAIEGRLNRQGVSYFYGASDHQTSIAEVRPHPGDKVSTGTFRLKEEIKVADFSETKIHSFSDSDAILGDFQFIYSINVYLNKVIPPSKRGIYSMTQLIADALRRLGYGGIKYLSSVGRGCNLTFFKPENLIYMTDSKKIFQIESLTYSFAELPTSGDDSL